MTPEQLRIEPFTLRVLRVLFELARSGRPTHAGALAAELGVAHTLAAKALRRLDDAGLVRAEPARLTMAGLVLSARLRPTKHGAGRHGPAPLCVAGRALRSVQTTHSTRGPLPIPASWERATGT